MRTQVQKELAKNHSLYQGLNKLEAHFLQEEMKDNFRLPPSILRRNAKKRAIQQRFKWFLEETTAMLGLVGIFAFCIVGIIIWTM